MLTFPTGRHEWSRMMDFANRYDADYEAMKAEEADIPDKLYNGASDLMNLALDLSTNGGMSGPEWGKNTPANRKAYVGALNIISRVASELALALELEMPEGEEEENQEGTSEAASDPRLDEDGNYTVAYLKRCHASLFDVSQFLEYVIKGEEFNLISCVDSTISTRRAFALAPEALEAATGCLDDSLRELLEHQEKRHESIVGALPPEPEEEGEEAAQSE